MGSEIRHLTFVKFTNMSTDSYTLICLTTSLKFIANYNEVHKTYTSFRNKASVDSKQFAQHTSELKCTHCLFFDRNANKAHTDSASLCPFPFERNRIEYSKSHIDISSHFKNLVINVDRIIMRT